MKTLKKGLLLAIFSTAIIVLAIYFGLIGGNNLTVFAETQDCKLEQLEAFTNSDSFEYRVNDISYKGTIHDFVENHKDKNNTINGKYIDDPIIYLIPKSLFTEINQTHYIGKEYGFYINTYLANVDDTSLKSDIILFDIEEGHYNSNREIITRISPVFQLSYFTVFKSSYSATDWNRVYDSSYDSVVRSANISSAFHIKNIRFGYMVLNEHSLNQGDFQYDKYKDNGAIISQTRFNFKGVTVVNTTEEERTETLVEIGYGAVENYIPYAKEIKNVISLIDDATGLISHKPVEVEYNNEANIYTHKDRAEQLATQAQLTKVSYIKPCYSTYLVSSTHYAEGVCVLDNISEDARLIKSIAFDIYSGGNRVAEFNATKFDTYTATVPEFKALTLNDNGIYFLPKSEQRFNFNPIYGSEYSFNTDKNLDVEVWSGNKNLGNTKVVLEENGNYDIKIKANKDAYGTYVLNIIPIFLTLNEDNQILAPQGEYILGIDIVDNGIYEIQSNNLDIKAVLNNDFQSIENINSSTKSKQFLGEAGSRYYFIVYNSSHSNLLSKICCSSNIPSLITSNNIDVNANKRYFSYQTNDAGYYSFTLSPQAYLQFYDDTLHDISHSAFILSSSFSTTYTLNLKSNQKVIVSLINSSADIQVKLEINKIDSVFKWVINGEEVKNNVAYVERGGRLSNVQLKIHDELIDPVVVLSNNYLYKSGRDIIAPIDTRLEETVLFLADDFNCFPLTINIVPEWQITILSINDADNIYFQIVTSRANKTTQISDNLKVYYSLEYFPKIGSVQQYNVSMMFNDTQTIQCFKSSDTYVGSAKLTLNKVVLNENSTNPKVIFNSANKTDDPYKTNINAEYIHSKYANDPNPTANNYGDASNPFLISNVRHFRNIKFSAAAKFKQTENINFNNSNTIQGFTFTGFYEGQNYELQNIKVTHALNNTTNNWGGMFSSNQGIIQNVVIKDLFLSAVNFVNGIPSTSVFAGGIVGENTGAILSCKVYGLLNCYSTGSSLGGIAGSSKGSSSSVSNCANYAKLFSYGNVGGIVGYAESSFLYKNDSACEISFYIKDSINNSAGGIVGYSIYTDIYECWNCSSVKYASASSESRTLAPRMGNIAGTFKYGKLKDNRYTANVYYGELKVVTWKGGFLNLTTYTWDQRQYVNQFGDAGELVSF